MLNNISIGLQVDKLALRRALDQAVSAEQRRRLKGLMETVADDAPEPLRAARAVELLERINTPQGRLLLEEMAGGNAEARLTQEAKEALIRLAKTSSR